MFHKRARFNTLQLIHEDLVLSVRDLPLNRLLLVRRLGFLPRDDDSEVVHVHNGGFHKRLGSDQNALSLS